MRVSDRDETEKTKEYIKTLNEKDMTFWSTIDRRVIFRSMRQTMLRLGIDLIVPMNLVDFTAVYCEKYGDSSIERITQPPRNYFQGNVMTRDYETYSVMRNFCMTMEKVGLAPYGVNIIKYDYFIGPGPKNSLAFCFRFWNEEDHA